MSTQRHLKLIIDVDGTCRIDAVNFVGPACQIATQELTAALGGTIQQQHDKPELRLRADHRQTDAEQAR